LAAGIRVFEGQFQEVKKMKVITALKSVWASLNLHALPLHAGSAMAPSADKASSSSSTSSTALIVHPQHWAAQQRHEARARALLRARSRSPRQHHRHVKKAAGQDLPAEAWAVVANHAESGLDLGRMSMVSRAAHRGVAQEHWRQLCISVW